MKSFTRIKLNFSFVSQKKHLFFSHESHDKDESVWCEIILKTSGSLNM
jgi:hypothetical protein